MNLKYLTIKSFFIFNQNLKLMAQFSNGFVGLTRNKLLRIMIFLQNFEIKKFSLPYVSNLYPAIIYFFCENQCKILKETLCKGNEIT